MGAKKSPYYRIVVADSKSPRDGRFIEEIGTYNPITSPSEIVIDAERVDYWIKNGAKPTDTVRALIKKAAAASTANAANAASTASAASTTNAVQENNEVPGDE